MGCSIKKMVDTIRFCNKGIANAFFSTDEQSIYCVTIDGIIEMRGINNEHNREKENYRFSNFNQREEDDKYEYVELSPDGRLLVSHTPSTGIEFFDVIQKDSVCFKTEQFAVYDSPFSPRGKILAVVANEDVLLIDVPHLKIISRINASRDGAYDVAFAHNRHILAIAPSDNSTSNGRIELWDIFTQEKVAELLSSYELMPISISPNGNIIAAGTNDGMMQIGDTQKRKRVNIYINDEAGTGFSISFSPDSHWLASVLFYHPEVRLWNVRDLIAQYGEDF